jgi:ribosomal protein S18 acetylase RimI-like enzyme
MLSVEGFTALIPLQDVATDELHRLDTFVSGRPELDDFVRSEARQLHDDHLSCTSLIFHDDFAGLVGYITLTNDAIPLTQFEVGQLGLNYNVALPAFPAVKICKLAVHSELQSQGIGKLILELAIGEIVSTHNVSSARFIITDAVNDPRTLAFYERMGFIESYWATEQAKNHKERRAQQRATIKMLLDIYGDS